MSRHQSYLPLTDSHPDFGRTHAPIHNLTVAIFRRGPKPKLSDQKKQLACSMIETWRANGMSIGWAIAQTAKQYKTTPRAMREIWQRKGR